MEIGAVRFKIRNQIDGKVSKIHAIYMCLTNIEEYVIHLDGAGNIRNSTYVMQNVKIVKSYL